MNDGGPAFPAPVGAEAWMIGMSLRDYFAASALANKYTSDDSNPDKVAEWAYQVADAMLSRAIAANTEAKPTREAGSA